MSEKKEKDKKDLTVSQDLFVTDIDVGRKTPWHKFERFGTDTDVGSKTTRHALYQFGNEINFVTKYNNSYD